MALDSRGASVSTFRIAIHGVLGHALPEKNAFCDLGSVQRLEAEDPVKAQKVKLRYLAGVPLEGAAPMLEISPATAKRYSLYDKLCEQ